MRYIAHTANLRGEEHELREHLSCVSNLAHSFAIELCRDEAMRQNLADLARWAGLLHDIGKYRDAFQVYLRDPNRRRGNDPDTHHAVYGAALAQKRKSGALAFVIGGHHAGLHDYNELENLIGKPIYHVGERLPEVVARFESEFGAIPPEFDEAEFYKDANGADVFVRMLFSALIDADFLDTEKHFKLEARTSVSLQTNVEGGRLVDLLLARLHKEREEKARRAAEQSEGTDETRRLNELRNRIYAQCVEGGAKQQSFFNLTVPTGGGKTLAGMAFALSHAARHGLRRAIIVIPYLSIIEQNAAEYRRILDPHGEGYVIENHSSVALPDKGDEARPVVEYAAENWDAPIVITTAVQFVESLFAARPARCRKLHNIARSIVIFDEAQTLPAHLLHPLLNVLKELRSRYGVSFVFSTATQPAFRRQFSLKSGFTDGEVDDLIADTEAIYKTLRRVRYELPRAGERRAWDDISREMRGEKQSLAVVNLRRHARELWERLKEDLTNTEAEAAGVFHLSSAMCAAHRLHRIGEIREPREGSIRWRLQNNLSCHVVSTQLIEAGVDVDFPLVFRALAPLDSIVQAAGRCNREGRLRDALGDPQFGRVVVFIPSDEGLPSGAYRTATETTAAMLHRLDAERLAIDPTIFADYFSRFFQNSHVSNEGDEIEKERAKFHFRTVQERVRVITDQGTGVVAPYGEAVKIIDEIRNTAAREGRPRLSREDFRRLQRYMVNVRENDFAELERHGQLENLFPQFPNFKGGIHLLNEGSYHEQLGLLIGGRPAGENIL